MFFTEEKLGLRLEELAEYRYRETIAIPEFAFQLDEQGVIGAPPPQGGEWSTLRLGEGWGGYDAYAWLKADVGIPSEWKGRKVVGRFWFGGTRISNIAGFESLLYLNGSPYQGVDSNHQEVFLPESLCGATVSLIFRLWSGLDNHEPLMLNDWSALGPRRKNFHRDPANADALTHPVQHHSIGMAELAWLDEAADDLYYTGRACLETLKTLPDTSTERHSLLAALNRAFLKVDWSRPGSQPFYASVAEAQQTLRGELAKIGKISSVTVNCIGHTHIDVAWLWQLKHSREKGARSFSTVLRMMELFPDYIFLQSQPQLYDYIKTDYPSIYEQIKDRVKEGRWEASGGMWLESDCNLTSGESLVRQILLGTRFLRDEFGVECTYLWLPDVFGYSWALPQILRKSGLTSFMTVKLMINQYNKIPHDTFHWRGIDGSVVLGHLAGHTYNQLMTVPSIRALWDDYKDKAFNSELLYIYGYGDGGGGVNREMLELRRRYDEMPGMPNVVTGRADEYFARLQETVGTTDQYVHTWDGELYFEYHRGTYTAQAFVKKANRKCELELRETEWLNVLGCALAGGDWSGYSGHELHEAWKIVLRNQFHDIIPGSSIREVYEDCRIEYAEAEQLIGQARFGAVRMLTSGYAAARDEASEQAHTAYTVLNGSTLGRTDLLSVPLKPGMEAGVWTDRLGRALESQRTDEAWLVRTGELPAMGFAEIRFSPAGVAAGTSGAATAVDGDATADKAAAAADRTVVPPFAATESGIITPYYEIRWNDSGQLVRLYDREAGRDILAEGARGNVFQLFEDKPMAHDAWDIDIYYQEKMREVTGLTSVTVVETGLLRTVVRFGWAFGESSIRQDMIVYAHSRRIDFVTTVDWNERQQLLKVSFPVDIHASEATYDIQYGNVKRPTHWNTSWDYARFETVGHQWADLSEQGYGVSLLNDCKYGYDIKTNVMRLSLLKSSIYPDYTADQGMHEFTYALFPHRGGWAEGGTVAEAWSLNNPLRPAEGAPVRDDFSLFGLSADHVMIDAVKKAEDGDAVIVRIHEFTGARGSVELSCGLPVRSWRETDLMERPIGEPSDDPIVRLHIKPYEIRTILIQL